MPDTFVAYSGRQFASDEFLAFAKVWGFQHVTSSPSTCDSLGKISGQLGSALDHWVKRTYGIKVGECEFQRNRRHLLRTNEQLLELELPIQETYHNHEYSPGRGHGLVAKQSTSSTSAVQEGTKTAALDHELCTIVSIIAMETLSKEHLSYKCCMCTVAFPSICKYLGAELCNCS